MSNITLASLTFFMITVGFGGVLAAMTFAVWQERRIEQIKRDYGRRIDDAEQHSREIEQRMQARFDMLLELMRHGEVVSLSQAQANDFHLLEVIMNSFTLDEVNILAFELGLNPDQLGGDSLATRAMNLVISARNRGWIGQLITAIRKHRPGAI